MAAAAPATTTGARTTHQRCTAEAIRNPIAGTRNTKNRGYRNAGRSPSHSAATTTATTAMVVHSHASDLCVQIPRIAVANQRPIGSRTGAPNRKRASKSGKSWLKYGGGKP